ncbi:MAG: terminase small subunit [Clostridia bacterium]|nr:terminase small subunit [Clostridia bacterium]
MMNKKKKIFARQYLSTGDARQSAVDAGYKNANYASKLINDPEVKSYMLSHTKNMKIASADEVLEFLTSVMRGEEWEISVSVKKETGEKLLTGEPPTLSQRQKAAELLAKKYRLFSEEISGDKSENTFSINIKVI